MQDLILTPHAGGQEDQPAALRRRGHRPAGADLRPDRPCAAPGCWSIARSTATTRARTTRSRSCCARCTSASASAAAQTDLLQWLNTFVYTIKNNGELDAISRKWRELPLEATAGVLMPDSRPRASVDYVLPGIGRSARRGCLPAGSVWPSSTARAGRWLTVRLSAMAMVLGLRSACWARWQGLALARGARRWPASTSRRSATRRSWCSSLIYLGLPSLGIRLAPDQAALLAMVVNLGAYATEIVRAGIEAVPRARSRPAGARPAAAGRSSASSS